MANCTGCDKDHDTDKSKRTWWSCQNYFGITGYFCGECYDMISHDPYQKPHNPGAYLMMFLKLGLKHDTL